MPKHYLPPIVRLCGKLEMLDRLLPKLKATDHRVCGSGSTMLVTVFHSIFFGENQVVILFHWDTHIRVIIFIELYIDMLIS